MSDFSKEVKKEVLVKSARHCCICHRYKGVKVEVHHMIPQSDGGSDDIDNTIALCFDCHADAGHYNKQHPRGTKFTLSELRKARDTWYGMVESNRIQIPLDTDYLYCRYLICKSIELLKEITLNSNLSVIPVENTVLVSTPAFKFQQEILRHYSKEHRRICFQLSEYKDVEEYIRLYPKATRIDKSLPGFPYFETTRIPVMSELSDVVKNDAVIRFLMNCKVPIEEIVIALTYFGFECGDGGQPPLIEEFRLRPLIGIYLAVENVTREYLTLDSLSYVTDEQLYSSIESDPAEISKAHVNLQLPSMPISPNSTVIIPVMTVLAPFEHVPYETSTATSIDRDTDYTDMLSHVSFSRPVYGKFHALGPTLYPEIISLRVGDIEKIQYIHQLDLSNTFLLDRNWRGGSCPYVFYVDNTKVIRYARELFRSSPDVEVTSMLKIPYGATQMIIAELEEETTYIQAVRTGNITALADIVLHKGDNLVLAIASEQEIRIAGYYMLNEKYAHHVIPASHRNENIGNYFSEHDGVTDEKITS